MWRQVSGSTLAQVMACCLTVPSHLLNQFWLPWWNPSECTSFILHIELENFNFPGANELIEIRGCTPYVGDRCVCETTLTADCAWWRHRMKTFFALLALCAGCSLVTGEFPLQRPVTRSFDIFFYLRLNKRFSKQSWGWWFETPSRSLWRHCNGIV